MSDKVVVGLRGTAQHQGDTPSELTGELFAGVYPLGPHVLVQLRGEASAHEGSVYRTSGILHTQAWF